jgi:hypothetical protein
MQVGGEQSARGRSSRALLTCCLKNEYYSLVLQDLKVCDQITV